MRERGGERERRGGKELRGTMTCGSHAPRRPIPGLKSPKDLGWPVLYS